MQLRWRPRAGSLPSGAASMPACPACHAASSRHTSCASRGPPDWQGGGGQGCAPGDWCCAPALTAHRAPCWAATHRHCTAACWMPEACGRVAGARAVLSGARGCGAPGIVVLQAEPHLPAPLRCFACLVALPSTAHCTPRTALCGSGVTTTRGGCHGSTIRHHSLSAQANRSVIDGVLDAHQACRARRPHVPACFPAGSALGPPSPPRRPGRAVCFRAVLGLLSPRTRRATGSG